MHRSPRNRWCQLMALLLTAMCPPIAAPADPSPQPPELGRVNFRRGYDAALAEAKKLDRPLLVLFQEIPGCNTCTTYGERVLSHPLLVEAAESLFVPVVVVNNAPGDDARVLKMFEEPANNNPVVRILSPAGEPLVPRVADNYAISGLTAAMITALQTAARPVPEYLKLLHEEVDARVRGVERATFSMSCFWEGEAKLGGIRGVISTTPAHFPNLELVEVEFDPRLIDYGRLLRNAMNLKCADRAFTRSDEQQMIASKFMSTAAQRTRQFSNPDKEPKYKLRGTPYQHIPLSPLQGARVNNAVSLKRDPTNFLSPRQLALLELVKTHGDAGWPIALDAPTMSAGWDQAQKIVEKVGGKLP